MVFAPDGVVGLHRPQTASHLNGLERPTRDGESPVEHCSTAGSRILSTTSHEQACGKLGGPPSKAKDSCVTDSGRVP